MGETQRAVASQNTPTLSAQPPAPVSRFDTLASAPHSQLLALGLVVAFLGGGLLILRLRPRFPKDASSKASKKRRQAALNRIIQAQEAAQSTATSSTSVAADDAAAKARGLRHTLTAPLAAAADYLPSSPTHTCVASTSAAILSGLKRIGSAASGAFSAVAPRRRRAALPAVPPSAKGKERFVEAREEPLASPALGTAARGDGDAFSSALHVQGDGSTRRGKGRKGKGAQPGRGGGLPSPSLPHAARPHSSNPVMREVGVSCAGGARVETSDAGVQTDPHEINAIATVQRGDERHPQILRLNSDPTPRSVSPPPRDDRARAEEDSSLPDDPPSVSPPPHNCADAPPSPSILAAPASLPPILPIPFDLHASFRSTPTDPALSSSHPPTTNSPSASSSSYPPLTFPPLSPSRSPSLSTSAIPSTSTPSGSPTSSQRAHSPITYSASARRTSSAVEVNGHLAVTSSVSGGSGSGAESPAYPSSAEAGKSRKAQRKSSTTDPSGKVVVGGGGGVVGMPNAVAAPRKSSSTTSASASASSSPRSSTNHTLAGRRTSTASSSAGSSGGGLGGGGGGGGVSPMTVTEGSRTVRPGGGVRKRPSLQGLGVEMDRERERATGEANGVEGQAGRDGFFASYAAQGARTPSWTSPESSPFPTQRSISGSFAAATNGQAQPPWSPQQVQHLQQLQQYQLLMSQSLPPSQPGVHHQVSRPPSRGGSLSVPPSMSQHTPTAAQQQQQQQQAYAALAAQAQIQAVHVQATYQQVMALHVQRQQQVQHGSSRRRGMSTGPTAADDDGFLSPATATPATPSGFYPLSALTSPPTNNGTWSTASHPASPMVASFAQQQLSPQSAYAASPTSASFPGSAAAYPYSTVKVNATPTGPKPGPAYLGSPPPANASVAAAAAAAAYQQAAYQQQQQYARASGQAYPPQRPRLTSSVSSVAALGSGNGSKQPPGGPSKKNGGADKTGLRNVSNGSTSEGATSGGVQLGDPPAGWKNKLKQSEMECERTAKELEIAKWRLTVLEEEQRASELDSQEALKALATRAIRAEARIKLFEEAVSRATNGTSADHVEAAPPSLPSPASSSPVVPATASVPNGLAVPGAGETEDAAAGSPPGKSVHPLAWLDLDAVSFSSPRPLGPPRSPQFPASPKSSNNRRRNSRQSFQQPTEPNGISRRRSSAKRKPSTSPTLAIPLATAGSLSDDDDDVVIVLDAPLRHRPIPRRSPSRRSSYVGDDEALDQDGGSLLDEDEIPSIDIDEGEPIAGGAVVGESEDGLRLHPEYIGFLPSYLSPIRFGTSPALVANGHASSVPSFVLDVSPTLEPVEFVVDPADTAEDSTAKLEVPTLEERDSPDDPPTPLSEQGHGFLPMIDASPSLVNGHSDKSLTSPVESGEPTPRVAFPPSPPEDTDDNYLTKVVKPASPVDIPLPPSPDLAPAA
ncbi:hypothetical protein JCM10295v2_006032 [Rhodotorula toruloides]